MINILFQDQYIAIVEKQPGMLSESGDKKRSLPDLLQQQWEDEGSPSSIFPVHRLDSGVGGIMVYTRTKEAAAKFEKHISDGSFLKEYYAVVRGTPAEQSGKMTDFLYKDVKNGKTFVVRTKRKGVKEASLQYQVCQTAMIEGCEYSLLRIRLETGRTHQIRVQCSSRKMPLWADHKYGGREDGNIGLYSFHLSFTHPITGEAMNFIHYPEKDVPWNFFSLDV